MSEVHGPSAYNFHIHNAGSCIMVQGPFNWQLANALCTYVEHMQACKLESRQALGNQHATCNRHMLG